MDRNNKCEQYSSYAGVGSILGVLLWIAHSKICGGRYNLRADKIRECFLPFNWQHLLSALLLHTFKRYISLGQTHLLVNLLKPTGHVMHHQFNIQQLYALPTLYWCVLCLSENKQRLVPVTA
jgi:hypothetical protein